VSSQSRISSAHGATARPSVSRQIAHSSHERTRPKTVYRVASGDLLKSQPNITALFVANNLMTLGALDTIRERGLKIPDDISIVGFEDMPWAALL
jgi:DNA-binding LacI/PurR family transcriptional regulator